MSNNKTTINPWDWDLRVRERNLKHGILTDKDVEKQLGQLADMAENAEESALSQPALDPRDDEEEDEDEGQPEGSS